MKKYTILLFIIILTLFGCGDKPEENKKVFSPADILSKEDIKDFIDFEPVIEETETTVSKTLKYKNATLGVSDLVEVTVYSENDAISKSEIEEKFNFYKTKNKEYKSIIPVEGVEADCFIAIPSAYILKDGYLVIISAGSGGEDAQINLLRGLTDIAIKNMNR